MPVDENQFIEIEEIVEVDSTFEDDIHEVGRMRTTKVILKKVKKKA